MSSAGVDLVLSLLSDQEVLHQKLLAKLFKTTWLAQALGIWPDELPPTVRCEPAGKLFDLMLYDGVTKPMYVELKVDGFLTEGQEAGQRAFAKQHKVPRAYILLGPTYFCWRGRFGRLDYPATVIGPVQLADALNAELGRIGDEALHVVATSYLQSITERAEQCLRPHPTKRTAEWFKNDHRVFRFLDDIRAHWPPGAEVYEMPNRGGHDRILNPGCAEGDSRVLRTPTKATVYWEIVDYVVRFKVSVEAEEHRKAVRQKCRVALWRAAVDCNEIFSVRGRTGKSMTIGQLNVDVFAEVLNEKGQVEPKKARALFERCERLLDAMIKHLRAMSVVSAT